MATEIYKTIFQLKRGTADRWIELNPILEAGEPGFELDTGKLKIGDGKSNWRDLDYINKYLFCYPNKTDFPNIGNENYIYKSNSESILYQWNTNLNKYEQIKSIIYAQDILDLEDYIKQITYTKSEIERLVQESSGAPEIIYGGLAENL